MKKSTIVYKHFKFVESTISFQTSPLQDVEAAARAGIQERGFGHASKRTHRLKGLERTGVSFNVTTAHQALVAPFYSFSIAKTVSCRRAEFMYKYSFQNVR